MRNLPQILTAVNMVVMVLLIISIILQNRSTGLSNVFGGAGTVIQTRRGFEKWLFFGTIALAIIFVGLSITALFVK